MPSLTGQHRYMGVRPDGSAKDPGRRPGRRGWAPAGTADRGPGQVGRPVRRHLPGGGFHPVQRGQRGYRAGLRTDPVQEPQPEPAHHHHLRILSRLPVRLMLVDSRPEQLDRVRLADVIDGTADVSIHPTLLGEQVLERLPAGAHAVIMTHDHAEDYALCDAALRLPRRLGGIGLIGSSAKWTRFQAQLADAGHSPETIARITCPIGQPGITGKDPAVIAVAVAAELLSALGDRTAAGALR